MMASPAVHLLCLIEGTGQPFQISIPADSDGDTLRQLIFRARRKVLPPDVHDLVLLKVNVDPHDPNIYLPLLRYDQHVEGVEQLVLSDQIQVIWQELPPADRIHVFVTFDFEDRHAFMEAAHLVYNEFWNKNLDNLLEPVPDCGNFKYLTREKIERLGLRESFYFPAVALLVREEYKVAYDYLRSHHDDDPNRSHNGMIVTGQPGIGKSCFLYYLLFRLLGDTIPVAFQLGKRFILFKETGVQLCDAEDHLATRNMPRGTWALSDSLVHFEQPCAAFLFAGQGGIAWVVQTTSPAERRWKAWKNQCTADIYWMDVSPLAELIATGKVLQNYNSWGPSARLCISLAGQPEVAEAHESDVVNDAFKLTMSDVEFDDLGKGSPAHRIFVQRPTSNRRIPRLEFGTDRLRAIVARAYAERSMT
ncbi:hypothetical protein EI94DRAFT_1714501 [Lactarius quietus]|nr:hypothetical protein EI94DRAFT_1714501 [Lactarius quietus]